MIFPAALADFLYNTSGRRVLQHNDVALYDDDVHVHAFVDARSLNLARLAASQKVKQMHEKKIAFFFGVKNKKIPKNKFEPKNENYISDLNSLSPNLRTPIRRNHAHEITLQKSGSQKHQKLG